MKIFIAFMLLFFTNCLAPVAISATVNAKMAVAHSVISPNEKLNFREKLSLKVSKKDGDDPIMRIFFVVGVLFLVLGLLFFKIADNKSKANAHASFAISFNLAGLGEQILGLLLCLVAGLLLFMASVMAVAKLIRKIKTRRKTVQ
jgi:protein-S-isoprenylcysteine O-methyltransferase Ste14